MIPYKTSKDYKRLKELIDEGKEIICLATSCSPRFKDVCVAKNYDNYIYVVSSRGIEFTSFRYPATEYLFKAKMREINLEFIEPNL